MTRSFTHQVQIYYEDTDHSGFVYHANYLKYFERAREHVIGADVLASAWREKGVGAVVYKASIIYSDGARFGDLCEVRTRAHADGDYRTIWQHELWRPGGTKPAVSATVELVCVDQAKSLIPTLEEFLANIR